MRLLTRAPSSGTVQCVPARLEGVFRKAHRQAERGAVPAGGIGHPALGRPGRRAGHYEPDVRDDSLNGFRSRHRMFPMSATPKWAKSGKPDVASGSAQVRSGCEKCRGGAPKGVRPTSLGAGCRVMASPTCRVMARYGCGDPHQRRFGAPPPQWGKQEMPKAAAAKVARVKRSVGCLKS